MTETIQLDLPEVRFLCTTAGALAAKTTLDLHQWMSVGYQALPDELKIIGAWFWRQEPWEIPAGYYGDVPIEIDPRGDYTQEADFPAYEDCVCILPKLIGAAFIKPGEPRLVDYIRHNPPMVYRRGDKLTIPVENNNAGPLQLSYFPALMIASDFGDFPLEPGTVYRKPVNVGQAGTTAVSGRIIIPKIAQGGTQIRVGFGARQFGLNLASAGIGVRVGQTADMVAAPATLDFGGTPGFTLPVNGRITSGWRDLVTTPGMDLLVDMKFNGPWACKMRAAGSYYSFSDTHATAAMASAVLQADLGYCVDWVQVR